LQQAAVTVIISLVMSAQTKPEILIPRAEVKATVERLASEITGDYTGKHPLLLGVLKGSFMFMADLVRYLDFPLEIDFVKLSSYGSGQETSGEVKVVQGVSGTVRSRHVLIVEDIIDVGLTAAFLRDYILRESPSSLRICALIDKPARRQVPIGIDYFGFSVPDRFIVGYGLDCAEQYRNLPDICYLKEES